MKDDEPSRIATFAADLERFGELPALIEDGNLSLSYRALAEAADAFAESIGKARRLLVVEALNDRMTMIAILGALRGRHPAILVEPDSDRSGVLAKRFCADFIVRQGKAEATGGPSMALHPDLALMLSTSGTTGSTKLVRLSHGNIGSNAESIAQYLEIESNDRALTSLAPHYSYGLSVLTSHWARGAAIVLYQGSVVDPEFRQRSTRNAITSLAGVPQIYDLLERTGFRDWAPPSIRTLTQAGGRLPSERAVSWAGWAKARNARFFVMYGQTEASPRIAYVPPELLFENADCIGRAIPGGELSLIDTNGESILEAGQEGELVYRGPNVMMGYGLEAGDLARGIELERLVTGDLGVRQANGLFRITGRKSRFVKPFGLRVSLDQIEDILREQGLSAAVTGSDSMIAIAVEGQPDIQKISNSLVEELQLPTSILDIVAVSNLPVLANGKTDYRSILREAEARSRAHQAAISDKGLLPLYAAAFPKKLVTDALSFVELGGDSLNYVLLAAEIEDRIGHLPDGWEEMPVRALDALVPARTDISAETSIRWVDSEIVLRALAICAVVANHASNWPVGGGVVALIVLVGFNLARFQFTRFVSGQFGRFVLRMATRILIPYYLLLCGYALFVKPVSMASWLLLSNYEGRFGSLLEPYWFIEAFFQSLLVMLVIGLPPPVRRFASVRPFGFGICLMAAAVASKILAAHFANSGHLLDRTPDELFVYLALGWCIHFARSPVQRAAMMAIAVCFGSMSLRWVDSSWWHIFGPAGRGTWVVLTAALLLYFRRFPLPNFARSIAVALSAASFTIYMIHILPITVLRFRIGLDIPIVTIVLAILVSYAVHVGIALCGRIWARGLVSREA